mgnify:CR=1 FL=1
MSTLLLGNNADYGPAGSKLDSAGIGLLWYVIHTASRHEFRVEARLRQKGFEAFLPTLVVPSRRQDRRLLLTVPLFPGYLFVRTELIPTNFYEIVQVPGIARILGFRGRFEPVPEEVITSIRLALASPRFYGPTHYLKRGRRVRIVEGPLAGAVGIVKEHKAQKRRLVINIELFRRALQVELADEAVEPY